jgi:hypothetical protein
MRVFGGIPARSILKIVDDNAVLVIAEALFRVLNDATSIIPPRERIKYLEVAVKTVEDMIEHAKSEGGVH